MQIKTERGMVDVMDADCAYRPCLHIHFDYGPYTAGRGYTKYHENPELVCMTRHQHGCPQPIPEPDWSMLKCCDNPKFGIWKPRCGYRKMLGRPESQKCLSCGQRVPGKAIARLAESGLIAKPDWRVPPRGEH